MLNSAFFSHQHILLYVSMQTEVSLHFWQPSTVCHAVAMAITERETAATPEWAKRWKTAAKQNVIKTYGGLTFRVVMRNHQPHDWLTMMGEVGGSVFLNKNLGSEESEPIDPGHVTLIKTHWIPAWHFTTVAARVCCVACVQPRQFLPLKTIDEGKSAPLLKKKYIIQH